MVVLVLSLSAARATDAAAAGPAPGRRGAGLGLAAGATVGVFMSTFDRWTVHDDLVDIRVHSLVDAGLVGLPGALVGGIVGARAPRDRLAPSRWHVYAGVGASNGQAWHGLRDALEAAGRAPASTWWFARTHWPGGMARPSPWSWTLTAEATVSPALSVGLAVDDVAPQRLEARDTDVAADVTTAGAFGCGVLAGRARLAWSACAGPSWARLAERGGVGGARVHTVEHRAIPVVRGAVDWRSTSDWSLRLQGVARLARPLEVPASAELPAHELEFTALDVTLGVRRDLGRIPAPGARGPPSGAPRR